MNSKLNGTLFSRKDFLSFVQKFDVICFTETWKNCHDVYVIPGYVEYSVIRKKHKKAKKNSGGISVFVANHLSRFITEIKSKSRNILWLHIEL